MQSPVLKSQGASSAFGTRASARSRGISLIECMVYMAVLSLLMTLGISLFHKGDLRAKGLRRNADDVARVLKAGERWRAEVREAAGVPQIVEAGGERFLRIPKKAGAVEFAFRDGTVWRRAGADAVWEVFLQDVKDSRMEPDARRHVSAWRWELELKSGHENVRVRPLFSFLAVRKMEDQR